MGRHSLHRHSQRGSADVQSRVYRSLYDGLHRHRNLHLGGHRPSRFLVHLAVVVPLGLRDVVGWSI